METLTEWLNNSLKDIRHEEFKDVVKVSLDIKPMDDGQVVIISDINRGTLTLETSKGEKKQLKVVAKVEPSSEAGKIMANDNSVFENEILMYSEVLKTMKGLMMQKGDTTRLWPECYHCGDRKLIFEDLCEMGYKIVPTYQFLDYDHALLVMQGIAKFHALSMVMVERNMFDISKLQPCFFERRVPFLINLHKMYIGSLAKVMKETWGEEWWSAADNLLKLVENPGDAMVDMCDSVRGQWSVINHGDFSMRNMLFHYQPGSTKPDGINFIDFQACHYGYIGVDLVNVLYSSMKPTVRDENLDALLNGYVESLTTTCKSQGFQGRIPTVEDIKSCLKAVKYHSVTTSLLLMPFFVASGKEDVQKLASHWMDSFTKEDVSDDYNEDDNFFNNEEVIEVIKYEIRRMIKENIL